MILTKLTLTNFGVFRGRQTVQLAPRPSRPIILFGGKNGSGKSTLFEAIRVCLYGSNALGARVSKEAYLSYLDGKIHTNPNLLIQPTFASVTIEFQYADVEALYMYTVTRSWERRDSQKIVEHLEVQRDGKPLDDLSAEHWQDFVRELIPPGVSQLFFFDGEKIQQLAEDTSDQQTLADAIKSLLGLDITERLQTDLGLYLSRQIKPSRNGQFAQEVEELQQEIENVGQELNDFRRMREKHETRLVELRTEITRVEAKVTAEGGSFARDRTDLLQHKARVKTHISHHEDAVRELCAGLLPFALVPKLCFQLKAQLMREEQAARAEAGQTLLQSAKEEVLQRVETHDFWSDLPQMSEGLKREIRDRLTQAIREPLRVEQTEPVDIIHQMSTQNQRQLLSWIDQATFDIPKASQLLSERLESLYRDLHRTEERLRKIPAEDVLKPLIEEIHGLHQEMAQVGKWALVKDEEIKAAESKLNELQRRFTQATEKLAAQAMQTSRIQLAHRVQEVLDEYQANLIEKKVTQLQGAVSECFNTLCRKKDSLRRIIVNPKDFSVTLYDRQNRPLPKMQLSAGEKQIYAISMLWALAKTSGRPLPIIVDTPLARLDSDHRKLLVQHYFPAASYQVLLLSTDTEVDQSYFAELRRDIAHAYRLDFDPVEHGTTMTPGYFWKHADEAHQTTSH